MLGLLKQLCLFGDGTLEILELGRVCLRVLGRREAIFESFLTGTPASSACGRSITCTSAMSFVFLSSILARIWSSAGRNRALSSKSFRYASRSKPVLPFRGIRFDSGGTFKVGVVGAR